MSIAVHRASDLVLINLILLLLLLFSRRKEHHYEGSIGGTINTILEKIGFYFIFTRNSVGYL